jgi:hypothetical protein
LLTDQGNQQKSGGNQETGHHEKRKEGASHPRDADSNEEVYEGVQKEDQARSKNEWHPDDANAVGDQEEEPQQRSRTDRGPDDQSYPP